MISKVRSSLHSSLIKSAPEDGHDHLLELSQLAEKDPDFYKYLQENDSELLQFNPDDIDDGEMEVAESAHNERPILTKETLRNWQKALLEVSLLTVIMHGLASYRKGHCVHCASYC